MESQAYAVIYVDKFADDRAAEQQRERIRRRFQLSESGIARLSCGDPIVVKRGVPLAEAKRYQSAIRAVGGVCWIQVLNENGEYEDRRQGDRRALLDRRERFRASSILPDRRGSCGRRSSDQ